MRRGGQSQALPPCTCVTFNRCTRAPQAPVPKEPSWHGGEPRRDQTAQAAPAREPTCRLRKRLLGAGPWRVLDATLTLQLSGFLASLASWQPLLSRHSQGTAWILEDLGRMLLFRDGKLRFVQSALLCWGLPEGTFPGSGDPSSGEAEPELCMAPCPEQQQLAQLSGSLPLSLCVPRGSALLGCLFLALRSDDLILAWDIIQPKFVLK